MYMSHAFVGRSCSMCSHVWASGRCVAASKMASPYRCTHASFSMSASRMPRVAAEVSGLQAGLEAVVGQDDAKKALVLALIAQEHVYIEGPPGVAKTMLAESAASLSALRLFTYQMHRDTRLAELVGDSVIVREDNEDGGEVIRHATRPGGILKAEVCVLDDISRAPGEALNVLLRLLNERMFGSDPIPLLTAIATSNPALDNYYVEPLDPANLDRFTLQVRAPGLIQQDRWDDARRVMEMGQQRPRRGRVPSADTAAEADATRLALLSAHEALWEVRVGSIGELLLHVLREVQKQPEINERNSLISDRTFLVKAVKVMRANAVLERRHLCLAKDLYCLTLLTTFRVPPEVHKRVPAIIDKVIKMHSRDNDPDTGSDAPATPKQNDDAESASPRADGTSSGAGADAETDASTAANDTASSLAGDTSGQFREGKSDLDLQRAPVGEGQDCNNGDRVEYAPISPTAEPGHDGDSCQSSPRRTGKSFLTAHEHNSIGNLSAVLRVVEGSVERGAAVQSYNPGGSYRHTAPLRAISDFHDIDGYDLFLWTRGDVLWPRSHIRQKPQLGGQLVICRDISNSMLGWRAKWAAQFSSQLVLLAKRHRMRIGYVEFSDSVEEFLDDTGAFLSRDYDFFLDAARITDCAGGTNYQLALQSAMSRWANSPPHKSGNRHILFVTDGWPTVGDRWVAAEREQARRLGIRIHTVYIGCPWTYPTALHFLSEHTHGAQFSVYADPAQECHDGAEQITVEERNPKQWLLDPTMWNLGATITSLPAREVFELKQKYAPREEYW